MTTSPAVEPSMQDLLDLVQEGLDEADFEVPRAEQALAELSRRIQRLQADVARLTAALEEAHTDCHALAAGVLIAQGMHDDAEEHGLHATGEEVDGAIGRAVWRAGGAR